MVRILSIAALLFVPIAAAAHDHAGGAEHASSSSECKKMFESSKDDLKACRACVKKSKHHFHKEADGDRCRSDDHAGMDKMGDGKKMNDSNMDEKKQVG